MKVPLSDILFGNRKRDDYGDLEPLAQSIQKYGLIQPIVIRSIDHHSFKYELVAGGRRFKAHLLSGMKEIEARLREECDDLTLRELELEENIRRKQLTWAEECQMQLALDEVKRAQVAEHLAVGSSDAEKWELRDTAKALDQAVGKTSQDLQLAKAMKDRPELALELIKFPKHVAFKKLKQIEEKEKHERLYKNGGIKAISNFTNCDCREGLKGLEDNSIDLIITDPPYGIADIDDAKGSYNDLQEEHDNSTEGNVKELLTQIIPELYRVLKPGAHFYMFYGSEMYQFIKTLLEEANFIVDPVPLIWYKGRTTTPFYGYSYQQTYEPIFFAQKPPREVRQLQTPHGNIFEYKPVDAKTRIHTYHKPPELIKYFIENSSHKGQVVLDPFAGSGQVLKSAKDTHRNGVGFELSKAHYLKTLEYLK